MIEKGQLRIVPPRCGVALQDELEGLERKRAGGQATDADLARLEELPGLYAAEIVAKTIILTLAVATRRGGFRRGRAMNEAREWLKAQGYGEVEWQDMPDVVRECYVAMQQGASIAGALVDAETVNFRLPAEIEGWLDVPDYLFQPALLKAWELNPHWAPEFAVGDAEKNESRPGLTSSGKG